jgi:hypothetical protein
MSADAKSCCKLMVLRSPLSSKFRSISVHNRLSACGGLLSYSISRALKCRLDRLAYRGLLIPWTSGLRAGWCFVVGHSTDHGLTGDPALALSQERNNWLTCLVPIFHKSLVPRIMTYFWLTWASALSREADNWSACSLPDFMSEKSFWPGVP